MYFFSLLVTNIIRIFFVVVVIFSFCLYISINAGSCSLKRDILIEIFYRDNVYIILVCGYGGPPVLNWMYHSLAVKSLFFPGKMENNIRVGK